MNVEKALELFSRAFEPCSVTRPQVCIDLRPYELLHGLDRSRHLLRIVGLVFAAVTELLGHSKVSLVATIVVGACA